MAFVFASAPFLFSASVYAAPLRRGREAKQEKEYELVRATSARELKEQMLTGDWVAWVLMRREPSLRWQSKVDGVISAPTGTPLRLKAIRRRDGDHRVLLGSEGARGQPIGTFLDLLPEFQRISWAVFRLMSRDTKTGKEEEIALVYVPRESDLFVFRRPEGALLDLELPWEASPGKVDGIELKPLADS